MSESEKLPSGVFGTAALWLILMLALKTAVYSNSNTFILQFYGI